MEQEIFNVHMQLLELAARQRQVQEQIIRARLQRSAASVVDADAGEKASVAMVGFCEVEEEEEEEDSSFSSESSTHRSQKYAMGSSLDDVVFIPNIRF